MEASSPPRDIFAIVQREAGHRFAGAPFGSEGVVSLSWKPWWHIEVLCPVPRDAFQPPPRVDCVMLWLSRRERGLLPEGERGAYTDFVAAAFGRNGNTLAACCRGLLTRRQLARLADGRRLCLLAEGRLVNLAAAEGHPSAVMDMSFANQVLCAVYLATSGHELGNSVHDVPSEIDQEVARLKLAAMEIDIDQLTGEQIQYLSSWQEGTR